MTRPQCRYLVQLGRDAFTALRRAAAALRALWISGWGMRERPDLLEPPRIAGGWGGGGRGRGPGEWPCTQQTPSERASSTPRAVASSSRLQVLTGRPFFVAKLSGRRPAPGQEFHPTKHPATPRLSHSLSTYHRLLNSYQIALFFTLKRALDNIFFLLWYSF